MTSKSSNSKIHHLLPDVVTGKHQVSIYLRTLPTGDCYYGRFKVKKTELANGQRYITKSLRTKSLKEAEDRAKDFLTRISIQQEENSHIKQLSVSKAIDKFIAHYEDNLTTEVSGYSRHMLRGFEKSIGVFWREYIGNRQLNSISANEISDYETWRRKWAKNPTKQKRHGNYKAVLANRTIVWEINAFKQFLRWCSTRNLYLGQAHNWKVGKHLLKRQRRDAFSREQYKKLYQYMRTNAYHNVGVHKNDRRLKRHRTMLRAYILFMANTGMRVGEARHLTWGDIEVRQNRNGTEIPVISIQAQYSKNRKSRNAVGRARALKALKRWRDYLDSIAEAYNDNSFIFCNERGEPIQHFREGFNAVIKEAGLDNDANGKATKFTPYTLRHTYITFRLTDAKKMSIYALAKNCGTSVQMIEEFYSDAISEDFIDELTS